MSLVRLYSYSWSLAMIHLPSFTAPFPLDPSPPVLFFTSGPQAQQPAAVDHVTLELNRIGEDLSDFKSDLPCVTSGTCPVPSFRCSK